MTNLIRQKNTQGFTLIELILALVALGFAALALVLALKDFAEGAAATTTTYKAAGVALCSSYWGTTGIGKIEDFVPDEQKATWEEEGLNEEEIKAEYAKLGATKFAKCVAEVEAEALRATAAQEKFDISNIKCVPEGAWPENLKQS
jgi:prepilin-type N-terminal cleavage/methylation domain-containing protein